jgi:hypothetical protein
MSIPAYYTERSGFPAPENQHLNTKRDGMGASGSGHDILWSQYQPAPTAGAPLGCYTGG